MEGLSFTFTSMSPYSTMRMPEHTRIQTTSLPFLSVEFLQHKNVGRGDNRWTILPVDYSDIIVYRLFFNDEIKEIIPNPSPIKGTITNREKVFGVWPERTKFTCLLTSSNMEEIMMLKLIYG